MAATVRSERLRSVKQVAAECPAFTTASLRWLIYSDPTFNDACVVRVAGRVLIDLDLMDRWLEAQRGQRHVVMEAQRTRVRAAKPVTRRRRSSQR